MLNMTVTTKPLWDNEAEGYIFFVREDFEVSGEMLKVEETYPRLKDRLAKHQFTAKKGQSFVLTSLQHDKLTSFIFVGLGKGDGPWHKELEILRRGIGSVVGRLKKLEIPTAVMNVPCCIKGVPCKELAKHIAITAKMADYEFKSFKSGGDKKNWEGSISIVFKKDCGDRLAGGIAEGNRIGDAINQSRQWCDMPPNIATPTFVANEAKKIAESHGLTYEVFGREKAQELGMGGFLCVDEGSDRDGKFVVLEYKSDTRDAKTIALVGKGVTFDSGGISLKPSSHMSGMKYDMSGAAAVLGAMNALADLKPNVNIIAITPLVENMPSGKSSKQDDIIRFMNGKTAEVKNTDAEGRLILADALCYAEKFYNPDIIVDLATLTGACVYALGHFYSAIMSFDKELVQDLSESGLLSGDKVWELPFDEDYRKAIESDVADISNTGSTAYSAGTMTAGLFLSNFVDKPRWAHIDIAGTADGVPNVNYLGKGATGVGIRLLIDFVLKQQ
jgi:leucyl aminopeptidase